RRDVGIPPYKRLDLQTVHFNYTEKDINEDIAIITDICEEMEEEKSEKTNVSNDSRSVMEQIQEAKQLLDSGIITEEEFTQIKSKLISQL
ncbi:MAG: SHOCT domain-containing protein, partial [Clostridia bacterium]|nr:SHOCT domain-containing protein [Clostridia bacterium]